MMVHTIPGIFNFDGQTSANEIAENASMEGTHSFDSWTEPIGSPKVLERQLDWVDAPFEFSKCLKCGARFTTTHGSLLAIY